MIETVDIVSQMEKNIKKYNALPRWRKLLLEVHRRILNSPKYPGALRREIKWFIQRGRRGWSQADSWDAGYYCSKIMMEIMDYWYPKQMSIGATINPETGELDFDVDRWNQVIKDVRDGFKAAIAIKDLERMDGGEWTPSYDFAEEYRVMNHGLDVFKEHLLGLWD